MATVASGTTGYYETQNSWPECPTITAVADSLGVMLGAVTRIQDLSVSGVDGKISATIQGIHPMVDFKTLTLIPTTNSDSSIKWNWGWSPDFPPQFRPKG
jgi:hypothetical protein